MKKTYASRAIILWVMLTIIAVVMQSAPVYLGNIGFLFSALVTMAMIFAASVNPTGSIVLTLVGTGILAVIEPQEAAIFFFLTAPLGIGIGAGEYYKKGTIFNSTVGAITLFIGMMLCAYGIKIPILGEKFSSLGWYISLPLMIILAAAYSTLWSMVTNWISKKVVFFHVDMK